MNIKNVTVFGSGVLGAQIAFQTAYHGYNVTLFDINEELLELAKLKLWDIQVQIPKFLNRSFSLLKR